MSQAAILTAFCAVAIQADDARQEAHLLRQGLQSNREIGKAIGMLMAFHRVDENRAFEILRTTSNELNMKVSAVAAEILRGHHDQLGS